jgi:hypothetical protein
LCRRGPPPFNLSWLNLTDSFIAGIFIARISAFLVASKKEHLPRDQNERHVACYVTRNFNADGA